MLQTLGAISGSFSFESPGCAAQIPPPLSLSTSQSANALISPEASEQSRAPEEKSRAAVLSQLVAEAAATPLPDDPAPQPSAAGSLLIKEKDSSVAFADTPNGALHAGALLVFRRFTPYLDDEVVWLTYLSCSCRPYYQTPCRWIPNWEKAWSSYFFCITDAAVIWRQ